MFMGRFGHFVMRGTEIHHSRAMLKVNRYASHKMVDIESVIIGNDCSTTLGFKCVARMRELVFPKECNVLSEKCIHAS